MRLGIGIFLFLSFGMPAMAEEPYYLYQEDNARDLQAKALLSGGTLALERQDPLQALHYAEEMASLTIESKDADEHNSMLYGHALFMMGISQLELVRNSEAVASLLESVKILEPLFVPIPYPNEQVVGNQDVSAQLEAVVLCSSAIRDRIYVARAYYEVVQISNISIDQLIRAKASIDYDLKALIAQKNIRKFSLVSE